MWAPCLAHERVWSPVSTELHLPVSGFSIASTHDVLPTPLSPKSSSPPGPTFKIGPERIPLKPLALISLRTIILSSFQHGIQFRQGRRYVATLNEGEESVLPDFRQ